MLKADFTRYSLALIDENKIIFSSAGRGLKPLASCLEIYRHTKNKFILHDKVTGLAAAKLIVYAGFISCVQTLVASQPAKKFLEEHAIKIDAQEVVANILKKDRSSLCPGEVIALNTDREEAFIKQIMTFISSLNEQKR